MKKLSRFISMLLFICTLLCLFSACSSKTEETPKETEHVHTPVTDEGRSPTCTEDGMTEGSHCSECGEILTEQAVIKKTGHKWESTWSYDKDFHFHSCGNPGCEERNTVITHTLSENGSFCMQSTASPRTH